MTNSQTIHILLGSTSQHKLNATKSVATELLLSPFEVTMKEAKSGVPSTPRDEQTKVGATNRANIKSSQADLCIGLESGLVERFGDIYEESWACVIKDGHKFYGYSSGLRLPNYIIKRMDQENIEHGPLLRAIRNEIGVENDKDTWGLYSNYKILRQTSLEEALRNALLQALAPEDSLWNR